MDRHPFNTAESRRATHQAPIIQNTPPADKAAKAERRRKNKAARKARRATR